jgi:hypothetical protein
MWMLTQEMVDRDFPAPKEWTFLTKVAYHAARGLEVPGANDHGVVNWMLCGLAYRDLLRRLEDSEVDGKSLTVQVDGGPGFDVEHMSYEWRRGYYEALMGCGRAAIELEDAVLDTTREMVFKRAHMIGPSNVKPKTIRKKGVAAPLEENCVPFYAPPETYYMKILTTKGFTAKEKLDAALAYGNWLDFKGLHDTAEDMYQWGLDLALSGYEGKAVPINVDTGIIKTSIAVTDNILDATTALAVHRAQAGDTSSALPIFLSILRARREAPQGDLIQSRPSAPQSRDTKLKRTDLDVLNDQISSFWSLLQASKFPDPPPSGNDPYTRTPDGNCEEAALMSYIGEILFASDKAQRDAGLSWTKSAVENAYIGYGDPRTTRAAKLKCVECLRVASENRRRMVQLRLDEIFSLSQERDHASSWQKWIPGLLWSEQTLRSEQEMWERENKEAVEFEIMLQRGRVYDVGEERAPMWGTSLLREWILPRLTGARTFEV